MIENRVTSDDSKLIKEKQQALMVRAGRPRRNQTTATS